MSTFVPGIPEPGEYQPAFEKYVRKADGHADPVKALTGQLEAVMQLLERLSPEKQNYRYAEGKWTVKEVLGHITDTERIFSYRTLRIARGDETPLPGFDENKYVQGAAFGECEWGEMLEEFEQVRRATISLLRHFPLEAWRREGISNQARISVRALAYILIGHVEHHLAILQERYL
jgi:hypothetical protein